MGCKCSDKLKSLSQALAGTDGVGISSITSAAATVGGAEGTNITFNMTDGSTQGPFFIADGEDGTNGTDGVSIDDIQLTDGSTASGQTATYTMYDASDNIIGTFQVYNGADGGVTIANVGSGADIFQEGSSSPFNFRSLTSSDGSINLNQSATEVDFTLAAGTWLSVETSSYGQTDAPKFNVPSGFTSLGNAGGYPPVKIFKDPISGLIKWQGAAQIQGAGDYNADPTGSASTTSLTIITQIPVAYQPANKALFPVSLIDFGVGIGHALVEVVSSTATLIIDRRFNTFEGGDLIIFEGAFYSQDS